MVAAHWATNAQLVRPAQLHSCERYGSKPRPTWSCMSSMKVPMGSAFSGWKMYECGELSTMMVCARSRPRHCRSCNVNGHGGCTTGAGARW